MDRMDDDWYEYELRLATERRIAAFDAVALRELCSCLSCSLCGMIDPEPPAVQKLTGVQRLILKYSPGAEEHG